MVENFDVLAETAGGVNRLRDLVIELALQGRLVEQRHTDEPAKRLVDRARQTLDIKFNVSPDMPRADLPPGWVWTSPREMGELSPRNAVHDDATVAFVPMPAIPTDYRQPVAPQARRWGEIKKGYTHFGDGDIVVAKITPCFQNRKSCVMRDLPGGLGAGTTELLVLRPVGGCIEPSYLLLFFKSPRFIKGGVARMTGTAGQQRVPGEYFASVPIPLPPFAEQKRIVARVDQLMALCDELEERQIRKRAVRGELAASVLNALETANEPEQLAVAWERATKTFETLAATRDQVDGLRQVVAALASRGRFVGQNEEDESADHLLSRITLQRSLLAQKHGTRLPITSSIPNTLIPFPLPKSWRWVRLGDLCYQITDGTHYTPTYVPSGIPFLSVKDVSGGELDFSDTRRITVAEHKKLTERCHPQRNDILLTKVGTTGIAVTVDTDADFSIFVSLALLKVPADLVLPHFLAMILNSPFVKGQSRRDTQGVGNKNLVLRFIRDFLIPLPPVGEQERILTRARGLSSLCDELERTLSHSEGLGTRLANSLVAAATNGDGT